MKTTNEKKGFRKLTEDELKNVTGGGRPSFEPSIYQGKPKVQAICGNRRCGPGEEPSGKCPCKKH